MRFTPKAGLVLSTRSGGLAPGRTHSTDDVAIAGVELAKIVSFVPRHNFPLRHYGALPLWVNTTRNLVVEIRGKETGLTTNVEEA